MQIPFQMHKALEKKDQKHVKLANHDCGGGVFSTSKKGQCFCSLRQKMLVLQPSIVIPKKNLLLSIEWNGESN
jgi:hypothetical protein